MSLEIALVPRQISDNNLTFSGGREICERKIIFSLLGSWNKRRILHSHISVYWNKGI